MRRLLPGLSAVAALAASAALAQSPAPAPASPPPPAAIHVRGTVESVAADTLVVHTRDDKTESVHLDPTWAVVTMKPIGVDAIQPGSFIGTTEVEKADGSGESLEVHVFPPGVKMGEGHYPWDLQPHAMMTNGTIGTVAASPKGRMVEVTYPGGMRRVLIPAGAPVVAIGGGERTLIKPGAKVFIFARVGSDGALTADRIAVGEDGAAPPM